MAILTPRSLLRFHWPGAGMRSSAVFGANLHTTRSRFIKDSLKDRTKINTESTEYSKSESDDAVAGKESAFKPGESNPEEELGSQEKSQGDPLNVSPGNHDISEPLPPDQGGAQKSSDNSPVKRQSSGSGSPSKAKKIS